LVALGEGVQSLPESRLAAYHIMTRELERLRNGETSEERYRAVYNAHFMELAEEDAERFNEEPMKLETSRKSTMMKQARELASAVLAPKFVDEATEELDNLAMDTEMGALDKELDMLAEKYLTDTERYDEAGFRAESNKLIGDYFKKGEQEEEEEGGPGAWERLMQARKDAQKRRADYERFFGHEAELSEAVSGMSDEDSEAYLRKLNTEEAYNYGVRIGLFTE